MSVFHRILAWFLLAAVLAPMPVSAGDPASALARPDRPGPVMVAVGPTLGWAPGVTPARWGLAGTVVMPPDAAARFVGRLHDWNTALVLGGEWRRIDSDRTLTAFDVGLRRYLGDPQQGRAVLFAGAAVGIGTADYVTASAPDDTSGAAPAPATDRLGTFLLETGYELRPSRSVVLSAKVRWRNAVLRPEDFSNWSVHLDVGVPLPR